MRALATTAVPAILAVPVNSALAQGSEGGAEEATENTIIVTARKIEESIQDVPVAITAFDSEAIQRRSISELEDVAMQTPGLVFEDFSNGGFGTPTIRGATQFSVNNLEQNVSTFIDGIYIPRQYAVDIGSTNLERIEVVKGPQSALYGANAFAGAINYVTTKRSLTEVTASAEIEVSQYKGLDISGKLSVPVIEDRFSMRLALGISEYDGDWKNNWPNPIAVSPGTNGRIGGYDNQAFSIGASFSPFDALTVDFDYYKFDISSESRAQYRLERGSGDFNCSVGGLAFSFATFSFEPALVENQLFCGEISVDPTIPAGAPSDFPSGYVIDPVSYGLESESDIYRTNVSLELTDQITANYLFGRSSGNVFSAGQSTRDPINGVFFGGATVWSWSINPVGSYVYDSHEIRLDYESDSGIYVMVGGFLQDGDDQDFSTGAVYSAPVTAPITSIPSFATPSDTFTNTKTKAIFGRISIPLMEERLIFELEGRYTDEEKTQIDLTSPDPYLFSDKYFTPRANVSFKLSDDNLLYASVAKGIKSGGINNSNLPGGAPLIADEQFYGPDTNWTYEIGIKNSFMNGLATLNVAAFYIDWGDLQLSVAPTGASQTTTLITQNLGGASIKGIEIDGTVEPVEGLFLNAGLAYIDATYDEDTISSRILRANLCGDGLVCNANGDVGGNDIQRTSKLQWNVGAAYEAPVSDSLDFFGRVDVAGQSKQFASEINVATIEPRMLTNARLGVRADRWSFSIWGKNLFDKKYVSNSFYIGGSPFFSVYVPSAGNRRRLGATITFDY
ncbi:MAG: TonB-dependent receptor [Erythrobacter sp.]